MKSGIFLSLTLASATAIWTGCVGTLDGRHKAGLPLTRDKASAQYERTAQELWEAAQDVLNYNGKLLHQDVLQSTLEASVNDRRVWVKVLQVDDKHTKVDVQARTRAGLADSRLAHEIDKQIAIRLASGNLSPFTRTTNSSAAK